jgi:hypothetical protein
VTHYDVFNGDAGGMYALHLRLANPRASILVTGAKRDIALLEHDVRVEYFDHHYAGDVPVHRNLAAVLDAAPDVCTGILVDCHLNG